MLIHHYLLILGAAGLILYIGFDSFFIHFVPFVLGAILASLLEPAVQGCQKRLKLSRGQAAFLSLVMFLAVILVVFNIFIFRLYLEVNTLIYELPDYRTLEKALGEFIDQNRDLYSSLQELELPPILIESIDDYAQRAIHSLRITIVHLMNSTLEAIKGLPRLFLQLVITCIAAFFFSRDRHQFLQSFHNILPESWMGRITATTEDLASSTISFFRAEIALITMASSITITVFYLLGIDYALILGLTVGLLDIVPLIGPALILFPWILYSLLVGNLLLGLSLSMLYILLILSRQFLEARYQVRVGLHPLLTLLAIYLGISFFGLIGMILGPLAVITGRSFLKSELARRLPEVGK